MLTHLQTTNPNFEALLRKTDFGIGTILTYLVVLGLFLCLCIFGPDVFAAGSRLPGSDVSDKLEAAGTLLRIIDTGLFKWGARIFAGICIMSSAWALKEQRFGISIICIVGAIIFGTAPTWVKNIFDIGGGDSVFGSIESQQFEPDSDDAKIIRSSVYV